MLGIRDTQSIASGGGGAAIFDGRRGSKGGESDGVAGGEFPLRGGGDGAYGGAAGSAARVELAHAAGGGGVCGDTDPVCAGQPADDERKRDFSASHGSALCAV